MEFSASAHGLQARARARGGLHVCPQARLSDAVLGPRACQAPSGGGLSRRRLQRLAHRGRTVRAGHPQRPETEMGPVAFEEQLNKVLGYVRVATEEDGARVVCGGRRPMEGDLRDGFFVEPTILTGISNSARVAQE